jgi:hypothetical protein
MIRRQKDVDWSRFLGPADLAFIHQQISVDGWYPMTVFERLGNAILAQGGGVSLGAVRIWGQMSASSFAAAQPSLIARGDPMESLMRLKVLRASLFDFPAFDIPMLTNGQAHVLISYQMGAAAEEAACFQTMGFCEGVVSMAGGRHAEGRFRERSWAGGARTILELEWHED